MRKLLHFIYLLIALFSLRSGWAQSGCPNCTVALPALPADTVYLSEAPTGRAGAYYEADISFRMPKTTTPVAANGSDVAPNITINEIKITSVTNVPPGLNWEVNQLEFKVANETDGCVRFCGTPLQPGLYEVEVVVTAQVLIISQTTSFSFPILIEPAVSVTEGFTMENSSGCGALEVTFSNNVPSGGNSGFVYNWNFGNGQTSTTENPVAQRYQEPGNYLIDYQAIIDTAGYFLTSLQLDAVGCSDLLGNRPDIWVEVLDSMQNILYKSDITNDARLPLTYNLNLSLTEGDYTIKVQDKDDGFLGNADDLCGIVRFNRFSGDSSAAGDLKTRVTIVHPVDTVRSVDTVRVFAQPEAPVLLGYDGENLCKGEKVDLITNYTSGLQWYKNGESIIDSTAAMLTANQTGDYHLVHTSADGCRAFSDTIRLTFAEPPTAPIFLNRENHLVLLEPEKLPENYTTKWFFNNTPIPGATGITHCANASGIYLLQMTDEATGCSSLFSRIVNFNPAFAGCTTSAEDRFQELVSDFKVFPNPTHGLSWLQFSLNETADATLIIRNALGMEVSRQIYRNILNNNQLEIDLQNQPAGIYFLEMQVQDGRKTVKLIKQ